MPEFDVMDARSYYQEGSPPSLYFDECLADHSTDGETISEVLRVP